MGMMSPAPRRTWRTMATRRFVDGGLRRWDAKFAAKKAVGAARFMEAMKDERRVLPKDVDQLKKAGASYVNDGKWFKLSQEEGYAAS